MFPFVSFDFTIANDMIRTGATGYIGGSVLTKIISHFPDLEISALSRSTTQEFSDKYAHVNIIKGTFNDFDVIEKASSNSDIIIRKFATSSFLSFIW